jgi:uncharacterized protein YbjT (DUF2867 family)
MNATLAVSRFWPVRLAAAPRLRTPLFSLMAAIIFAVAALISRCFRRCYAAVFLAESHLISYVWCLARKLCGERSAGHAPNLVERGDAAEVLLLSSAFAKPRCMKRHQIAVMGGSGFIGRYVVKHLAERGEVLAVGGRHAANAKYLKLKGDVGQVGLVNIAIDAPEDVLRAFLAGKDALVNCVGVLFESGPQKFDVVHHSAPAKLARLAREAGVERLVHISAIGADPRSSSAYARSKAAGEQAVMDAFPTATILRPSVVFGPEDDFFNRFAAMAMMSPFLPLIGGGETRFQPVYVGDIATAVVRVLDDPATAGRTYELGGPSVYTFRQLLELMTGEMQRRRHFIDLPFGIASLQARLFGLVPSLVMPKPPLTVDQVEMLKRDNVVASGALDLKTLGIEPTAIEAIVPTYLDRFRRGGWYGRRRAVA